jgi:methionyl aminopeptidase
VSLDIGAVKDGFVGDLAVTVPVGEVSPRARELMRITRESLYKGIAQAREGNRLYDISAAVEAHVKTAGFSVVRQFVGHGIGRNMHEEPQIPNYGKAGTGLRLRAGMTFAIEPMVNVGTWQVKVLSDGWTVVTTDGSLSAHFEHSIAITEDGPVILSELD